ncbi:sensor histidine kinase KdpD, partial [Candidatus Sumerlaeota bacterium]|nr:sensor histidine kinase KdpD [Candidatus Sumerlaeota bacterium]
MSDSRPDPDKLLDRVVKEEEKEKQGRLKIFFGFAPGVGKTFAMLQEGHSRHAEGKDVVAGIIETHRRAETEILLAGLQVLPRREIPYHGVTLHEFDLDAALARRPALILVDELAHTNAPGSRHSKRWQDVEELLQSGINVYTTVNVQHVESLSDVVAQITGIAVRETVPDSILERADELELIDLPPEQLLDRLREGKVYLPDQAGRAVENFFRKGNLIALRELSLRRTAERVAAQMVDYRRDQAIQKVWPAADRLLVAVGPSPTSTQLVRATKRMAESQHAEWFAISVETSDRAGLTPSDRERVGHTLHLAEQLGAQTATVTGDRASGAILDFAREHNVTKIVAGKPLRRRLRDRLFGSIVDELIWNCGDIDIYVISGEGQATIRTSRESVAAPSFKDWIWSVGNVTGATLVAWLMFSHFALANLVMIYLLAVVVTASKRGRRASIIATCLGVASFDFLFVPPYYTFAVSDSEYFVTFAIMLGVGLLISELTARAHSQAENASLREKTTRVLFELSRSLSRARDHHEIVKIATDQAGRILEGSASVLLPGPSGIIADDAGAPTLDGGRDQSVARWAFG